MIVNQVLEDKGNTEDGAVTFLSRLERKQTASIDELECFTASMKTASTSIDITKVPYLDTEPRGVYCVRSQGLGARAHEGQRLWLSSR